MTRHIKLLFPMILLLLFTFVPAANVAAEEQEKPHAEEGLTFYSEPVGETFAYATLGGFDWDDPEPPEDSDMEACIYLASIATGEVYVKFATTADKNYAALFSPGGDKVLELSQGIKLGENHFALIDTSDSTVIWRQTISEEGIQLIPGLAARWDEELGIIAILIDERDIVLEAMEEPEADPDDITHPTDINDYASNVYFLSMEDGEMIRRLELNLTWPEHVDSTQPLCFGGGRFFVLAVDDPFIEERDTSLEQMDLFIVDPFSGDVERLVLPFPIDQVIPRMIVDRDGDQLFYQSSRKMEGSKLHIFGNDIIVLDPDTGDYSVLLEMTSDESYSLGGITPDGGTLCAVRITSIEGERYFDPIVVDVESGKVIILESMVEREFSVSSQISSSGRYVLEYKLASDIWIHDLETGDVRQMTPPGEGLIIIPFPGIPGGFNFLY